jgi:catechol 2,3-dioxygenase-like lactoylglutathione lyase family enzyme
MDVKIAVVSLWAEDVPTAAHFYRDVVGLRLASHHGGRPHFEAGGVLLVILKGRPSPAQEAEPERFPLLAFGVDDLEAAVERLRRHNVALPWGIEVDSHSRWAMFHDPAGNLIELVEFK